ncbi:hypothetical protein ERO13_D07G047150v2 [Gossypium hirsutum]|uniref:Uncharacterized protein n=1 Tax=Gossypium darwinii TaxID=34276 RepID=A0A5D2BSC1_GOSDA|nr:hypothetical protein ERO13_D07G047150v2 [Gossypium hirsutum]TYG60241.1 hypothetical protein ES288_D07G052600v1 [Gossypium darwinii]
MTVHQNVYLIEVLCRFKDSRRDQARICRAHGTFLI